MLNKKNVCLYDPIDGYIYTYKINETEFDKIRQYLINNKKDFDKPKYSSNKSRSNKKDNEKIVYKEDLNIEKELFSKDE